MEIDGAYVAGHVRQENSKADRIDRRLEVSAKHQSVVVARERGGRTLVTMVAKEADGAQFVRQHVKPGTVVHADEASGWDRLHAHYEMHRINHSVAYSKDGACTNQA